jgi:hypothetical protein
MRGADLLGVAIVPGKGHAWSQQAAISVEVNFLGTGLRLGRGSRKGRAGLLHHGPNGSRT